MSALAIQQIRRFNRTVAECIGALDEQFLGRALPLAEARLLWEIAPDGAGLRALGERLNLDTDYVNRVLWSLEQKGLVRVSRGSEDRTILTEAGLAERAELDRRSDGLALNILEPLSDRQRATLVSAVSEVERLLQATMVRFTIEDPASPEARWCFDQYFAELDARFEAGFDPALSISADTRELTPPAGLLLIARLRDQLIGCCAFKFYAGAPAELKRMWIAPAARGLGLGQRILGEMEQHAREAGVAVVRLETNRALSQAIALYRRSGYVEVAAFNREPYADHWFEKRLF